MWGRETDVSPPPSLRGHLTKFGDIFGCHTWGGGIYIYWGEVRNAVQQPMVHRMALSSAGFSRSFPIQSRLSCFSALFPPKVIVDSTTIGMIRFICSHTNHLKPSALHLSTPPTFIPQRSSVLPIPPCQGSMMSRVVIISDVDLVSLLSIVLLCCDITVPPLLVLCSLDSSRYAQCDR